MLKEIVIKFQVLESENGDEHILPTDEELNTWEQAIYKARDEAEASKKFKTATPESKRVAEQRLRELEAEEMDLAVARVAREKYAHQAKDRIYKLRKPTYLELEQIEGQAKQLRPDDTVSQDDHYILTELFKIALSALSPSERELAPNIGVYMRQRVYEACFPDRRKIAFL